MKIHKETMSNKFQELSTLFGTDDFYIAGGYLRSFFDNVPTKDIDIFVNSRIIYNFISNRLIENGFEKIKQRHHSCVYDNGQEKIDLVYKVFVGARGLINNFDLDCCKLCYYHRGFVYGEKALESIRTKQITFDTVNRPETLIKRIRKYTEKGYSIENAYKIKALDILISCKNNAETENNY